MRFLYAILALMLPSLVFAQPANVNRTLCTFDFEERRLGNDEDLPMNWLKVEGNNLPHYVNGQLSNDRAHGGKYSFRFDLNGGGLLYRYPSGLIKVVTGARYRVEGYVQTTPLPNARAVITAYFTDIDGHTLRDTLTRTKPYAAPAGAPQWQHLSIELTAENPKAAFLVIELGLLQPVNFAEAALGDRTLYTQDIHGSAWFDDVSVSQVPKLTMTSERPGNIFHRSDPLRLQVVVNDRFTEDLQAQLVIKDADAQMIFQRSGAAVSMSSSPADSSGTKNIVLNLPELAPGWYEVSLAMSSQGQFVGQRTIDLIRLADDVDHIAPDPRFGIDATSLPFEGWSELPQILPLLGAGRVKLAVWNEQGDIQQVDSNGFDRLLEHLQELGITPTGCLTGLPPDMAKRVNGNSWRTLVKADRALWQPQLAYMVARHANHLDRWQLGADGSDIFVAQPEMRGVYRAIYDEFRKLVQSPDLAMPWPAWYELSGDLPATVALSVPPEVLPNQIPLYMQDLRGHEGHNLSIHLQRISQQRYGRLVQIRDFAQRFAYTLAADAQRVDLELPFTVKATEGEVEKQPLEMFMIARTLMSTLSGSVYKGQVPIAEGVEAFLFDRGGKGILMLWDRGSDDDVKSLALNLGSQPSRIDLWGNVTPLLRTTDTASPILAAPVESTDKAPGSSRGQGVPIQITSMPFFLVDIDGQIAQLRSSVCFDNEKIESSFKEHTRHIRFTNPYRQAISGAVKLRPPTGWTINPPTFNFALNPGETFDRDLTIQFPYNTFAGTKIIDAEFQVQADRNSTFTVPLKLKLGLSDVGLQTLALRDGKDIIVQQMITNYGERPIDYTAFAICPGQARQERLVTHLGAGRTIIKKYRFAGVQITRDMHIRSGVKESEGTRILNDDVEVQ
jgi:hypothetical protein